jgi:hypothetical protein
MRAYRIALNFAQSLYFDIFGDLSNLHHPENHQRTNSSASVPVTASRDYRLGPIVIEWIDLNTQRMGDTQPHLSKSFLSHNSGSLGLSGLLTLSNRLTVLFRRQGAFCARNCASGLSCLVWYGHTKRRHCSPVSRKHYYRISKFSCTM